MVEVDARDEQPDLLDFDPEKVERLADAESVSLADYPDHWHTLGTDGSPIDLRLELCMTA